MPRTGRKPLTLSALLVLAALGPVAPVRAQAPDGPQDPFRLDLLGQKFNEVGADRPRA